MSKSRLKNSARNVISGCLGYLVALSLAFVSKHQFIKILGGEFNGLNGLFSNILNILNVVELGFGSAIIFVLYLPLKNEDYDTISQIVKYIKKVYFMISASIFCFGLISISFLKYLINEDPSNLTFSLRDLYFFYLLFLINNSLSYLLSHKKILLIADQKNYHVTNVDNTTTVIMHILQIILLIVFEKNKLSFGEQYRFASYMVFLVLTILKTLIRNIIILIIANKTYPFLKIKPTSKLDKKHKTFIFGKVKSMTLHKCSEAILNGSTTIIISAFIGLKETGIYSNYMLIVLNLVTLINIFFNALLASVGNLSVTSNIKKQYEIFQIFNFFTKFIVFFIFISLFVLLNDFMKIWLKNTGTEFFNKKELLALCIFAYVNIIRKPTNTFRDAKGLFSRDTFKSTFEVLIGIPISIVFAIEFGVIGAVAGYCFTCIVVSMSVEIRTLFSCGFKLTPYKYYFDLCKDFLIVLLLAIGLNELFNKIPALPKLNFLFKSTLTILLTIAIFAVLNFRTNEFKYSINLAKKFISKKKK